MRGKWHGSPYHDLATKKWFISFEIDSPPAEYDRTKDKLLDIEIKQHREGRSLNANALLWKCLGEIAGALRTDKWSLYLQMLKRYGEYTYICVPPKAVDMVKKQWRECEELGPISVNGREAVQMLCYYGSSTYDTAQFSRLLDGVIDEMKEMGLNPPTSEDMRRSLEEWERMSQKG
jgi:hypothetical protein